VPTHERNSAADFRFGVDLHRWVGASNLPFAEPVVHCGLNGKFLEHGSSRRHLGVREIPSGAARPEQF
jgi:hypothetical protein